MRRINTRPATSQLAQMRRRACLTLAALVSAAASAAAFAQAPPPLERPAPPARERTAVLEEPAPAAATREAPAGEFGALGVIVGPSPSGVLIVGVQQGSPADKVGLRAGSFVLTLNGQGVAAPGDLLDALSQLPPGDTVSFTVWIGGETRELAVVLADSRDFVDSIPKTPPPALEPGPADVPLVLSGVTLREADEGVTVVEVEPRSPAEQLGLRPGDVILGVGGTRVATPDELFHVVDGLEPLAKAQIDIRRAGRRSALVLVMPERPIVARRIAVLELPADMPEYARILLRQQQENAELIETLFDEVRALRAEVNELRR